MATDKKIFPSRAVHPGEILREELKARGVKQKDLAVQLGYAPSQLNEVIQGKRRINSDLAFKLEQALGITHAFWMESQATYDYTCIKIQERATDEVKAAEYERSCNEVINLKLLYKRLKLDRLHIRERVAKLIQLVPFDLREVRVQTVRFGLYRHSEKRNLDSLNMLTWIALNAIAIHQSQLPVGYQEGNAIKAAEEIAQMANAGELTITKLRSSLGAHGILYVEVPALEKAPVDAYSTIMENTPVISVTYRCDDLDKLAFDILHELCHIDRHLSTGASFIAVEGGDYAEDPKELEANAFARKMLIPDLTWKRIVEQSAGSVVKEEILNRIAYRARENGVSPTIAVARYKYETQWYKTNSYRSPKISERG